MWHVHFCSTMENYNNLWLYNVHSCLLFDNATCFHELMMLNVQWPLPLTRWSFIMKDVFKVPSKYIYFYTSSPWSNKILPVNECCFFSLQWVLLEAGTIVILCLSCKLMWIGRPWPGSAWKLRSSWGLIYPLKRNALYVKKIEQPDKCPPGKDKSCDTQVMA